MSLPFQAVDGGVRLTVRLTPRGGREAVTGFSQDSHGRPMLAVRIAAPPVDGEANRALVAFLAKALSLRKADIEIVSGETSRVKVLRLAGELAPIAARLTELAEGE